MAPFAFTISAYRAKLSQLVRKVGWFGNCLRQLDHVAAQRVRRTQQWITFNNRIWPGTNSGLPNIAGIRLSALRLPETSSYRTFSSPLTE